MEICVNALNGLLLISSKQTKAKASKTVDVSMPSTGFYLFLPSRTENQKHAGLESVNALNGLLLISSTLLKGQAYIDKCVSMPSTGFYLFLHFNITRERTRQILCQCPQRASTYFFIWKYTKSWCNAVRVNALNGLLLISSIDSARDMNDAVNCVNALNGLLLISSINLTKEELINLGVNALNGLLLISSN